MTASPIAERFLFGVSAYPEVLDREDWLRMLDAYNGLGMNVVRLGESAWGHLEPEQGRYDFDWLARALDDLAERDFDAIIGTNTYIAPQWLYVTYPDAPSILPNGQVHPMYRKAASLSHPGYRAASRALVERLADRFGTHSAIIAWQLDNEIDADSNLQTDYNPHAEAGWTEFLRREFGDVEEMNLRLGLRSWGMMVRSFEELRQPTLPETDSGQLPALKFLNLRYRALTIAGFLSDQAAILRQEGITVPIITNWMQNWTSPFDTPDLAGTLDYSGVNVYPLGENREAYWRDHAWTFDAHRSVTGRGRFLTTETRVGVTGTTWMRDTFPTRAEFRMWMFAQIALGSEGLIYWSGHRWHGGHWPHWGGLLNWAGEPEPDAAWAGEIGDWLATWGDTLRDAPVAARAAVVTDFDQRAALKVYPHTKNSADLLPAAFALFHRLGLGVDAITPARACDSTGLLEYDVVLLAAAPVAGSDLLVSALEEFAADGGTVVVAPFTAYQTIHGVIERPGPGKSLARLTGTELHSVRRFGTTSQTRATAPMARWSDNESSPLGLDGFVELLCVMEGESLARLENVDAVFDAFAIAARRTVGKGQVVRLGFWPADESLLSLVATAVDSPLRHPAPTGVICVPRVDGSLFVMNTTDRDASLPDLKGRPDRVTAAPAFLGIVAPFGCHWLKPL